MTGTTAIKGYLTGDSLKEIWQNIETLCKDGNPAEIICQTYGEAISLRQRLHAWRAQHGGFADYIIRDPTPTPFPSGNMRVEPRR